MKRLLNILSANRKFITAFVGLYVAYTIGYSQGSETIPNNSQLSLKSNQQQSTQTLGVSNAVTESMGVVITEGSPLNKPSETETEQSSGSATVVSANSTTSQGSTSTESSNDSTTKAASPTSSPSSKPSPTQTPAQTSTTIVSKTINASGKYGYMGQDITYELTFKNTGGSVTGTVGGACSGKVDGNYEGRDNGNVSGTVKGSCGVGFLSKKLDATYTGKVYLNRGIVNITLNGEIPFVEGDQSFSLSFNP